MRAVHDGRDERRGGGHRDAQLAGNQALAWLTPERLRRVTIGLVVVGLALSATVLSGSS